ncbi:arsinothricin resistance N-acetyltransferase ArsN1 family A [Paenibacillus sabinae]|uniref:N-acetyltransferase GCN5 n=1 Tax=Paenibacillus sabinae T27 TaxID=1268072 RepID=X4ZJB5_9BACL|nr:arsinothricin resistance N-acetyltransferase ArsN1 family A [Paenibacillus sabinae]AHV97402.1 N-acetyltransferase GCN5 [Paenibacillus sabinae T27]
MEVKLRRAAEKDAEQLAEIYNYSIQHERNATFETELRTAEDRRFWIRNQHKRHPIIVAECEGRILGWASSSPYRTRSCYDGIGEFSIYVHKPFRGKGIGKRLLNELIEECRRIGHWKLLSRIFDFNHESRELCKRCGFREVGIYEKHGQLDGRWIDCVIVEKLLISVD